MFNRVLCSAIAIIASAVLAMPVAADVPHLINYQGLLSDDQGNPVTDNVTLDFRIYDAETGGTQLWHETHSNTPVTNGVFNVQLGSVGVPDPDLPDDIFDGHQRWLGITANNGTEMSPRIVLASVPFAYRISTVDGSTGGTIAGTISAVRGDGQSTVELIPEHNGQGGEVHLKAADGSLTVELSADAGASANSHLTLFRSQDHRGITMNAERGAGLGSRLYLYDSHDQATVQFFGAHTVDEGAVVNLRNAAGTATAVLDADENGDLGSKLDLRNGSGASTVWIDADDGVGANLALLKNDGSFPGVELRNGSSGGQMLLYNTNGVQVLEIVAEKATGWPVPVTQSWLITQALEITGGSDLSEQFSVTADDEGLSPLPGMVVCIDPAAPGQLSISRREYDPMVAGIVSGAGGVSTGMLMGQRGSVADGNYPIALSGRVYCLATTTNGPIQPGDLLTTSGIPGHAMKASADKFASGSILGKAMTSLDAESGLVLVLVSLQ